MKKTVLPLLFPVCLCAQTDSAHLQNFWQVRIYSGANLLRVKENSFLPREWYGSFSPGMQVDLPVSYYRVNKGISYTFGAFYMSTNSKQDDWLNIHDCGLYALVGFGKIDRLQWKIGTYYAYAFGSRLPNQYGRINREISLRQHDLGIHTGFVIRQHRHWNFKVELQQQIRPRLREGIPRYSPGGSRYEGPNGLFTRFRFSIGYLIQNS